MAKGVIEFIDIENKKVTINGKEYAIGKKIWNRESLGDKLEKGIEIEYEIKGANFDFKRIISREEKEFINKNSYGKNNSNRNASNTVVSQKFDYPYNFVRVNEKVEREAIEKGELSGKILCSLTNRSPIFFPEPKKSEAKNQHSREFFFEKNGKYIIPASSLKGNFRSVLEAISNSCFTNIEEERLEKRLPAGSFNDKIFGIIKRLPTENEDGLIVEAEKVKVKIKALPREYEKEGIYNIKVSNLIKNYSEGKNIEKFDEFNRLFSKEDINAVLWIGSKIFRKEYEKILYPKPNGRSFKFSKNEYDDIKYLLNQRKEREKKNNKTFYFDDLKVEDPIIFQSLANEKAVNLAFSEIPRLRYKYSPYDLLQKELRACETFENACYACRIFGMTGNNLEDKKEEEKEKNALQGRVFFKDATIDKKDAKIQSSPVLIKSLGEPHPTLTGFYLEKGSYDEKVKIRGRKFYWHHTDKIDKEFSKFEKSITSKKEEKHNSSIQFMNHGNRFNFEVSFKNLKEDELGLLLLTLELEEGMLHKFGKAKALGFGSSEVKIEKLLLESSNKYSSFDVSYVESDKKSEYIDIFKKKFDLENKDQWKDLKLIMNKDNKLDFSKSPFPEAENKKGQINSLNWFMNMKMSLKNNFKLPKIQDYK